MELIASWVGSNMWSIEAGATDMHYLSILLTYHVTLFMNHCPQVPEDIIDVQNVMLYIEQKEIIVYKLWIHRHTNTWPLLISLSPLADASPSPFAPVQLSSPASEPDAVH